MSDSTTIEVTDSIAGLAADWDRLSAGHPLVSHAFLDALHASGSACERTGWTPRYLLLRRAGRLEGAMPLYAKSHSYGEYVFDWAWADAWRRAGLDYYPKLLCAVPFTPVTGPRLLAPQEADRRALLRGALQLAEEAGVSSFHCLFPREQDAGALREEGLAMRRTVQFHWTNPGYRSFDDFLATMNHDKRKKVKQERRKVREAGVVFEWKVGREILERDWDFFFRCYEDTYRRHHSTPYLNRDFFLRIGEGMPANLLLALGMRDGRPVCAALDVFDQTALYGRYWGAAEHIPGLHFEACYHQAIEFCIAQGIGRFEGGAQGEHKLARGLLPVTTLSGHWVADQRFDHPVRQFVERESRGVAAYVDELADHAPFKTEAETGESGLI
jgi:predicted N-acyltransferase